MKLKQAARPAQLVEVTLDSDTIINEFGEPLTFYTWDRLPMSMYIKVAQLDMDDMESMLNLVAELALDEDGQQCITPESGLSMTVLTEVIGSVIGLMGK